jgi:hypothetical protein
LPDTFAPVGYIWETSVRACTGGITVAFKSHTGQDFDPFHLPHRLTFFRADKDTDNLRHK